MASNAKWYPFCKNALVGQHPKPFETACVGLRLCEPFVRCRNVSLRHQDNRKTRHRHPLTFANRCLFSRKAMSEEAPERCVAAEGFCDQNAGFGAVPQQAENVGFRENGNPALFRLCIYTNIACRDMFYPFFFSEIPAGT